MLQYSIAEVNVCQSTNIGAMNVAKNLMCLYVRSTNQPLPTALNVGVVMCKSLFHCLALAAEKEAAEQTLPLVDLAPYEE